MCDGWRGEGWREGGSQVAGIVRGQFQKRDGCHLACIYEQWCSSPILGLVEMRVAVASQLGVKLEFGRACGSQTYCADILGAPDKWHANVLLPSPNAALP